MTRASPGKLGGAHWARRLSPVERAAQLAEDERLIQREIQIAFLRTLIACTIWLLTGLALMGFGLHAADRELGQIAFFGGLIVGEAGMLVSLTRYYLRGEAEGWWH